MGSVHARGDTFLTFGLKALTQTNTSRLATLTHMSGKRKFYEDLSEAGSLITSSLLTGRETYSFIFLSFPTGT
jgi:hypothetical protein